MILNKSFLEQDYIKLSNISWHVDVYGNYWNGEFYDEIIGTKGITGTYYDIFDGCRRTKKEQIEELTKYGVEIKKEWYENNY